jgi:hypothetical protein
MRPEASPAWTLSPVPGREDSRYRHQDANHVALVFDREAHGRGIRPPKGKSTAHPAALT